MGTEQVIHSTKTLSLHNCCQQFVGTKNNISTFERCHIH